MYKKIYNKNDPKIPEIQELLPSKQPPVNKPLCLLLWSASNFCFWESWVTTKMAAFIIPIWTANLPGVQKSAELGGGSHCIIRRVCWSGV